MKKEETKEKENLMDLPLTIKLARIQVEFKANKSRWNSFGKYNFRSAEDILEGLKTLNEKYGVMFTIEEKFLGSHEGVPLMLSTAAIHDINGINTIEATALVGVDLVQKGMQVPQAFGSASSYGKKYALGNLLLIDDTQDADATNTHGASTVVAPKKDKLKLDITSTEFMKAKEFIEKGGSIENIKKKYDLTPAAEKELLTKIK